MGSILKYVYKIFYIKPTLIDINFNTKLNDCDYKNQSHAPNPAADKFELVFPWIYEISECRYVI